MAEYQSGGAAMVPGMDAMGVPLLKLADAQLYLAKQGGRARACVV